MGNVEVRFAKCCNPLPGDEIIGYITNFRGISVHRTDCDNVKALKEKEEDSRFVKVEWETQSEELYSARLRVEAEDRPSLLTDVMLVLNEMKVSINSVSAENQKNGEAVIHLSILVSNIHLLTELSKRIKKLPSVIDVLRVGNL